MNIPNLGSEQAAELAILRAERRFREVFERSPAGLARVGLDGTWLEINNRFRDMLGYTSEELAQMRPSEVIHPEDLNRHLEERERLISAEAQYVSDEMRYLRKDGSVVWIARTVSLVRDGPGTPQYFVIVAQDTTGRKQFEEGLRHATELSSRATTASRIGIFSWDLHSGIWEWDRTNRWVGILPEEVLSTLDGFLTIVVPEDRAEFFDSIMQSVKKGIGWEHEFRLALPPDGAVNWEYGRGSILRDQSGQPAYLTGAVINMTEYRLLRRQLQEYQELLLLAESAGGVHPWAVDALTSRRIWWTPASFKLYGRAEELGSPTREEFVKLVHPEDQEKIRDVYRLLQKSHGADTFNIQFRPAPKSGEIRWIHTKGRVHRDLGGWPLRLVGVDIDVTEQRRARETLRMREKLSVLERLATRIAHEFRNPLMVLANAFYLIKKSSTLEDAQKYAGLAQDQIAQMTRYSSRILPSFRRSSPVLRQRVREIVEDILNELKHRYPNVEVITDFRETRPLESSRDDVGQVATVILENAFDAVVGGGSVKVRVVERVVNGESGIRLMVGDSGRGMSPKVKARLFEPFFSTKHMTGLGLGLWTSSGIVQDLRGRIKVFSSEGPTDHGTVVSVFLPFGSSLSLGAESAPAKAA